MERKYIDSINDSIEVIGALRLLPVVHKINDIVRLIKATIDSGNKVIIAGNGGSAAHAQHFAAELTGKFDKDRVPLPALSLTTDTSAITAIANDYTFCSIFSRQLIALGREGDCFIALSTSGKSPNILDALNVCLENDMASILLTGLNAPDAVYVIADHVLKVQSWNTARIQEAHHLILHLICEALDDIYSEDPSSG